MGKTKTSFNYVNVSNGRHVLQEILNGACVGDYLGILKIKSTGSE